MTRHLRICIVESFASGRRPDVLPTQGAQLAERLERDGHHVLTTSYVRRPLLRAGDITQFLIRRRRDYDVVLIQMFGHRAFAFAQVASATTALLRKRLVLVLADGDLERMWRRRRKAMRAVLDRADVVVSPSTWLKELLAPTYEATVIPNIIDLGRYPFVLRTRVRPRLFWVRAYHAQYDPLLAVDVADALRVRRYDDLVLTMAGPDQGERGRCQARLDRLQLAGIVTLRGTLTKDELRIAAADHDIHLHTNRVDNMPVTFLEQMALGLPIVCANVGGIPHLVTDGETALVVRERTPNAYADAIARLVGDPQLAERLSRQGRAFVEQECSWPAIRLRWLRALGGDA